MMSPRHTRTLALIWFLGVASIGVHATERRVAAPDELSEALRNLQPGDTVVLASGEWRDVYLSIHGAGTAEAPITLRAEVPGEAVITGRSSLMMGGEYLVVEGLHFREVEPHDSAAGFVAFRGGDKAHAYRSRLVDCLFERCNPADGERRYPWVAMYGRENEVERCRFIGQAHSGVTIQVRLEGEEGAGHRIRRNHFLDRPPGDDNGFETIQIGQSQDSMKNARCLVEENIFERCDGEMEIVSVKTCENIVRHNLFLACAGTLTLRHGNRNVAESNIFLGGNRRESGGIRVIGEDHRIVGNYFEAINERTGGAIVIYCGIPDSPLNGYFAANRVVVENNLFLDGFGPALFLNGGLGDRDRSILAEKAVFRGNVIRQRERPGAPAVEGDLPDATFEENIYDANTQLGREETAGFRRAAIETVRRPGGLHAAIVVGETGEAGEAQRVVEPPAPLDFSAIGPAWDNRPPKLPE